PEAAKVAALKARLGKLDERLVSFAGRELSASQRELREEVVRKHRRTSSELARLAGEASAAQVLPLSRLPKQIATHAALVLWIDVDALDEHWACVVRREGTPSWRRLEGSGKGGAWTKEDRSLAARLQALLQDPSSGAEKRQELIDGLRRQRLEPLLPHLKAVRRLVVVPAGRVGPGPREGLAAGYQGPYGPSGTGLRRPARERRAA